MLLGPAPLGLLVPLGLPVHPELPVLLESLVPLPRLGALVLLVLQRDRVPQVL